MWGDIQAALSALDGCVFGTCFVGGQQSLLSQIFAWQTFAALMGIIIGLPIAFFIVRLFLGVFMEHTVAFYDTYVDPDYLYMSDDDEGA